MSKKSVFIFLSLIILTAAFLRLWQIQSIPPGLYSDEAMNGSNALEANESGDYKMFYPENNGREGFFINIQALSVKIFGNEAWALRGVSAIFGILTVLGLYYLAKELTGNKRLALFSSFILATSFWHLLFSRIGFRAIMAPFFLTWAFALLLAAGRKNSWKLSAFAGIAFGLGFHSYIAYRAAPLLLIFPFIKLWKGGQKKIIAVFLLGAFIAAIPLGWYFLKNPSDFFGRTSQLSVFSSDAPLKNLAINSVKTANMLFFYGDANWRHNLAGSPSLWWPVGILFLIGFFWTIIRRKYLLLFLWLIVMALPVVISNEGIPHALRSIILIPPVMLFAGIGLEKTAETVNGWIKKQREKYPQYENQISRIRKELILFLFVFLAAIATTTYTKYFIRWGDNINTYYAFNGRASDIANFLNKVPPQTDKFVIVNVDGVKVKNIPMPAQTVMFLTGSFTEKGQAEKHFTYLLPSELEKIKCSETKNSCFIVSLESDAKLRDRVKQIQPGVRISVFPGFEMLYK
ncbi:MAG: glycosyltransferase family 39 protein [Candidatus Pacebacteria bacterium]|nr:glycosyltransferase family 39 protein [Candidatus Paceibacterota bacterium]